MSDNLFLTGFMGAGKSSLGRELAAALHRRFVDLDEAVAKRLGMEIPRAFAELGEAAFRRAESAELKRAAQGHRQVVSTGGGAPVSEANRAVMRGSGRIVHLQASLEACAQRLGPTETAQRPLWQDPAALEKLHAQRQAAYADCDLVLPTDGRRTTDVLDDLLAWLLPEERFQAGLGRQSCDVISSVAAPQALAALVGERRVALVCDRNIERLHLDRYRAALGREARIVLPPGEGSKTLAGARRLYQALLDARVERGDLLVAIGGGVVTDLGAFVASTFKRGLDFILVATSLVACVDAAIGGKTAVNLGRAKNMVGTFAAPRAVILDLLALSTLPPAQVGEGLTEAYKTGLVADPALARLTADDLPALKRGDLISLAGVALASARAKAAVVAMDFREGGLRRILNLGHTYGHALESFNRFKISHGQAVAAGLMVAAQISLDRGLLSMDLAAQIITCARGLIRGKPLWPDAQAAWAIMLNDKKNQGGQVVFVLLKDLGQPLVVDDLTPEELGRALKALRKA